MVKREEEPGAAAPRQGGQRSGPARKKGSSTAAVRPDSRGPGTTGDRIMTERHIETAALELMTERGVLAGVNLREVSDRVGVNRGLVYHYFRDRRGLLRSALRRRGGEIQPEVQAHSDSPFLERSVDQVRAAASNSEYIRLLTLLVLDGDPSVKVLPLREWSADLLKADQKNGNLAQDSDLEAIQVLISSLSVGYSLLRQKFSEELKLQPDDLDERFWAAIKKVFASFRG